MTKIVQIAGGSAEIENLYVGPARELRADESNDELRLHDASKPGGFRFPNRDANDVRYQQKNAELDGFDFGPSLKGFPARTSPGVYRIRTMTVNGDNMTIVNENGVGGNPLFSLAPEIKSNHTFSGIVTFTQTIIAENGVTGNIVGDTIGDVTGDLHGDSYGTHHGPSIGMHTGGIDTRGATVIMSDKTIQLSWLADGILDLISGGSYPIGGIMIWSGDDSDIPDGFVLCNGANGTPDLRDKFIMGAGIGGVAQAGDTGGSNAGPGNTATSSAGDHNHTLAAGTGVASSGVTAGINLQLTYAGGGTQHGVHDFALNDPGHTHDLSGSVANNGNHTHNVNLNFDNRPAFYALCFLMKVA